MEFNRKMKYLVADTTAFLNTEQLNEYADNVLTVPDVVKEVKNKRQIRRLCVLPFDLQVREPRTETIKHCVEFAKKTGDYASLSGIDIKVIALTYELEIDNVGSNHLRTEPVMPKIVASKERPEEFQDRDKLAGWYNPDDEVSSGDEEGEAPANDDSANETNNEALTDLVKESIEKGIKESEDNEQVEISKQDLEMMFSQLKCESTTDDNGTSNILIPTDLSESFVDNINDGDDDDGENSSDEDTTWITPSNVKKAQKSLESRVEDEVIPVVACMSTDYAIQNVLKQMNLNVASLNGRIIKHLRTYILRCYACFKTTSIITKIFCPNCGNKTLKRVAVSQDENGKQVIHINTRRPLSTKYKNQPLPRFKGGKHSRNPILFEDQPIPRQMPSRISKTKTQALDEDYIAEYSPFAMRDVDSKSAVLRSKGQLKQWARNNTFEEDRRRKHYNRLYK